MVQTRNVAKRQKVEECTSCVESVMFNSDSLFKIASYLPAEGLLNLALTCRRFGAQTRSSGEGDNNLSLIEETARKIVHDVATNEQRNALPCYDGCNWLSKYNYLQTLREPLTFDQLVGQFSYVDGNKSCVNSASDWATAFSNNIMMAGKHYASFEVSREETSWRHFLVGVMRPGEAMQSAEGTPLAPSFYEHFTQRKGSLQYNNNINCCVYYSSVGYCYSHDWGGRNFSDRGEWDGMERLSDPTCKIGILRFG